MKLFINLLVNIIILFVIDAIWINTVGGAFYADQLSTIGRFTADGAWNVRVGPGLAVYFLMAFAIEIFVFRNQSIKGLRSTLWHAGLLGIIIYGVFDLTNRAILESYPMAMVTVDMLWGCALFTAIAFLSFHLRRSLTLL